MMNIKNIRMNIILKVNVVIRLKVRLIVDGKSSPYPRQKFHTGQLHRLRESRMITKKFSDF